MSFVQRQRIICFGQITYLFLFFDEFFHSGPWFAHDTCIIWGCLENLIDLRLIQIICNICLPIRHEISHGEKVGYKRRQLYHLIKIVFQPHHQHLCPYSWSFFVIILIFWRQRWHWVDNILGLIIISLTILIKLLWCSLIQQDIVWRVWVVVSIWLIQIRDWYLIYIFTWWSQLFDSVIFMYFAGECLNYMFMQSFEFTILLFQNNDCVFVLLLLVVWWINIDFQNKVVFGLLVGIQSNEMINQASRTIILFNWIRFDIVKFTRQLWKMQMLRLIQIIFFWVFATYNIWHISNKLNKDLVEWSWSIQKLQNTRHIFFKLILPLIQLDISLSWNLGRKYRQNLILVAETRLLR